MQKKNKGFTLIEMLVVVLIIGILAGVALPQYEMAVAKTRVASIFPIMRGIKDALYEYKLKNGDFYTGEDDELIDSSYLGVAWPSDWYQTNNEDEPCSDSYSCSNDKFRCGYDEDGAVKCNYYDDLIIFMLQPDDSAPYKFYCEALTDKGTKICKALGGKKTEFMNNYSL